MNKRLPLYVKIILFLVIPSLFGVISIHLGKDTNWDLRNYHFYNAYAFLNNRIEWDIVPAQWQTYINPLLDLPFYWMTKWLPAKFIAFILGSVHGLNVTLVFLIFWYSIQLESVPQKCLLGVFVTAISAFAPGFLSELGTTFNDNIVSIFVLAALLMLILGSKTLRAGYLIALAGLVMGLGLGLKLNVIIYAIGSGIALPFLFCKWSNRVRALLLYSVGGILGVAATAAAWSWRLWIAFGNPLLPFYNDVFRSPYVLIAHYTARGSCRDQCLRVSSGPLYLLQTPLG